MKTWLVLVVSLIASSPRAQEAALESGEAEQRSSVSVDLGVEVAIQGEEMRLPVILTGRNSSVLSTVNRIRFPSNSFSFEKVEISPDVEKGVYAVTANVRPAVEGEQDSTLELQIRSASEKALPNGILVLLHFRVSGDAEAGDYVFENSARISTESSQDMGAPGESGVVTILDEPPEVVACFFYMH